MFRFILCHYYLLLIYFRMRGLEIVILFSALCIAPSLSQDDDVCLEPDAVIPECSKWVNPDTKEPVFFEHQFNCSRFWVCNPDLSDCLHECARADEDGALFFDFSVKYPDGPTCNWPFLVDCENKENTCARCKPSEQCIACSDCPDCTQDCIDGVMCVCTEGSPCYEDNSVACGICANHKCAEPECCTDVDCNGEKCINGKCGECKVDTDCFESICSTCGTDGMCIIDPECCIYDTDCFESICSTCGTDHKCINPECCIDDDCASNEYCSSEHECIIGCKQDSDCLDGNHLECSKCLSNSCTNPECCSDDNCASDQYCDNNSCVDGCNENSDCNSVISCAECSNNQCTSPECCGDDDCAIDQYCDNNTCLDGCNEDSDCTSVMSCSECSNHQCTTPECCAKSDCEANHLSCSECQADNTCTNPECCSDDDCTEDNKPICDQVEQVCKGCKIDENCDGYDGICTGDYSPENSACFYCAVEGDDENGSCEPGCADDDNCLGDLKCDGDHKCNPEGSTNTLKKIMIHTTSCAGCSDTTVEDGVVLELVGKPNQEGTPDCSTNPLDHEDMVDYADGGISVFEKRDLLKECYNKNLQAEVRSGEITWKGQGTLTLEKVEFSWTDENTLPSVCTVGPLEQNQKTSLSCHVKK